MLLSDPKNPVSGEPFMFGFLSQRDNRPWVLLLIEGDMNEKEQATAAILRAQAELEQALSELEKMPAFDPRAVAFSAHALNNYLAVTGAPSNCS